MNREQRRTEQKAKQTSQTVTKQSKAKASPPRRPFPLWTIGILLTFGLLFGLWSANTAIGAVAKEKAAMPPVAFTPSPFAPDLARPVPAMPDAFFD